jgi:hypothetical protein
MKMKNSDMSRILVIDGDIEQKKKPPPLPFPWPPVTPYPTD